MSAQERLPLLIFDGDCGFCASAVGWVAQRVSFAQLPWQMADLPAFRISTEQAHDRVWLVVESSKLDGADALIWLLAHAKHRGWRLVGRLAGGAIVLPIARRVYVIVARNRTKLPGGTPACAVGSGRGNAP